MAESIFAYIPIDRRQALCAGRTLPAHATGAALFADISGFTRLTEILVSSLGARRGAEELTTFLNLVYDALIDELHRWRGSAIAFAGDAITCWFDDDGQPHHGVQRAISSAISMQRAMQAFKRIETPTEGTVSLSVKLAIAAGPVRRFLVGDPENRVIDVLAGRTLERLASAAHYADRDEVILSPCAFSALTSGTYSAEKRDGKDGVRYWLVTDLHQPTPPQPWPPLSFNSTHEQLARSWLLPAVYSRLQRGQGEFLAELRPAVALFVRFQGIDYDDDPEASDKLDNYIRWVQSVVARYDGTLIDLNIGDKGSYIYINFGAPIAHENDAGRAASTALELQQIPTNLRYVEPVQIGISQGRMRAGAYGGNAHRTYGVLGSHVNMAARLMMIAKPGQIIASQELHRFIEDQFTWMALPNVRVKGMSDAVSVFELIGTGQRKRSYLLPSRDQIPMVGRQSELASFQECLTMARQGHGQIVSVVGTAGIGKTRFVAESLPFAHQQGFSIYGGECEAYGINTSYLVWQPIWNELFDVDLRADLASRRHRIEEKLGAIDPLLRKRAPLLGAVLGLPFEDNDLTRSLSPSLRKESLESLLADCLRVMATEQPRMLILEDCQWLDELSHDLIEVLGRAIADKPVLIVAAFRPLELERLRANRVSALRNHREIVLAELQADELGEIADLWLSQLPDAQVADGIHGPLRDRIVNQAEGNPFYLEELINYIRYHKIDPSSASAPAQIELPSSLRSLILSRIDQLAESEQTTLRAACIIGRSFRVGWLSGYYADLGDLTDVKSYLDQLHAFDMTLPAMFEAELTYLFKHMVTYEVTYDSLPFATRSRLHERLARFLEAQITAGALNESSVLDALVHHYTHSDNKEKQRWYLQRASVAALRVSAFSAGLDHLTRLLELTPASDPERAALERQLGDVHYRLGDYTAAQAVLDKALAIATNDADRAATRALLAHITAQKGDYDGAKTILLDTLPLARASGDPEILSSALYALGTVHWRLGKVDEMVAVFEESLAMAQSIGDVSGELTALNGLGVAFLHTNGEKAERLFSEVVRRADEVGNRERVMIALANLGVLEDERANDTAARGYHRQALAISRELGTQYYIAHHLSNLAGSEVALGDIGNAKVHNDEALALAHRIGTSYVLVQALCNTVEIAYAEGDSARALALVGLMRRQPAWSSEDTHWINRLIVQWGISSIEAEAGMAKGEALDWETTIQDLLKKD